MKKRALLIILLLFNTLFLYSVNLSLTTGPSFSHLLEYEESIYLRTALKSSFQVDYPISFEGFSINPYLAVSYTTPTITALNTRIIDYTTFTFGIEEDIRVTEKVNLSFKLGYFLGYYNSSTINEFLNIKGITYALGMKYNLGRLKLISSINLSYQRELYSISTDFGLLYSFKRWFT